MFQTTKNLFGKFIPIMAVIVLGLFSNTVHAQVANAPEICNGKDDNGDGQIDEGLDCNQHYLSYRFETVNFTPVTVYLQDQFLQGQFKVVKPVLLLNPVDKRVMDANGSVQLFPMKRPELHYTGYQVEQLDPAV